MNGTLARLEDLVRLPPGEVAIGPQTVHIDVTNGCNTNCVTCWDHSPHLHEARPTAWKKQRVDVEAVRALLDDIQSLDTERGRLQAVILSGMGEPFTHPGIYDLIADVKRRGLSCTIITNLVAADVERIIDLGVDGLLIGVHGASERSYLDFHPNFTSWHWQQLHTQLAHLRAARDAGHHLEAKHVQVICRTNAHELVEMVQQAADAGAARLNFKLASLKAGTEAVALDDDALATLSGSLLGAIILADQLELPTNLPVFSAQVAAMRAGRGEDAVERVGQTAPIDDVGCFMGHFYSRITVDGTVLYCCNTDVEIGSLNVLPFSSWWRSAKWASFRRRLRDGRYLPSCRQCGKLNQNEKLSSRLRQRFGDEAWAAVTGHGGGHHPRFEPLARRGAGGGPGPSGHTGRSRRGGLPVLP